MIAHDGDGRGLVPSALRGFRTWHVHPGDVMTGELPLTSVTRLHVTWSSELAARCTRIDGALGASPAVHPDRPAPARDCACGIYAWYRPEDAAEFAAEVFGAVDASGVVLMGTRGFRAERVRIRALVTRNRRLAAACEESGIAVYRRRRALLGDYPPDDVTTLVGTGTSGPRPPSGTRLGNFPLVRGRRRSR